MTKIAQIGLITVLVISIIGIIVLAALGDDVPSILQWVTSGSIGALTGTALPIAKG